MYVHSLIVMCVKLELIRRELTVLKQHLDSGSATAAQTDDLRKLRARLEDAMKITEGDLQKSVFKSVNSSNSAEQSLISGRYEGIMQISSSYLRRLLRWRMRCWN